MEELIGRREQSRTGPLTPGLTPTVERSAKELRSPIALVQFAQDSTSFRLDLTISGKSLSSKLSRRKSFIVPILPETANDRVSCRVAGLKLREADHRTAAIQFCAVVVLLTALGPSCALATPSGLPNDDSKRTTTSTVVLRPSDTSLGPRDDDALTAAKSLVQDGSVSETTDPNLPVRGVTDVSVRRSHGNPTSVGDHHSSERSRSPAGDDNEESLKSINLSMPSAHAQDTDSCEYVLQHDLYFYFPLR
ncbi:hypothetical protein GWI33_016331 [Rhynchophorus ferrugineus]|uniref:Uncharacterized protein n=1 Tax=Rhynchophorus ferrugineus TaxID=354439 RepID=A0A834MAH4_RHYFE|nr:hypothetical protein GWI33_016331 [Rhynchophorus ferrugineus]